MLPMNFQRIFEALVWAREAAPVIIKSAVTLMVAAQTALTVFAVQIVDEWPAGARWSMIVVGGLVAAVAGLRRVTPVAVADRGVLPKAE